MSTTVLAWIVVGGETASAFVVAALAAAWAQRHRARRQRNADRCS